MQMCGRVGNFTLWMHFPDKEARTLSIFLNICPKHNRFYQTPSQNYEKRLLASSSLSVCLSVRSSVRMEYLGSHWMYLYKRKAKLACYRPEQAHGDPVG